MVEGARLESVYRGNSIEGSNPSLSAIVKSIAKNGHASRWEMFTARRDCSNLSIIG